RQRDARALHLSRRRRAELSGVGGGFQIERLTADAATIADLADLLVETVAAGGSVSFVHPLPRAEAAAFWIDWFATPDKIVLRAPAGGRPVATVTLHLVPWPNQPHHGEMAKLMTRVADRGRGAAAALMAEAEAIAADLGRMLLTLDTAEEEGAGGFYERLGY